LSNAGGKRAGRAAADIAADWSVYILNRAAALQVLELGATSFVLSPEDDFDNVRRLLAEFAERAVLPVYQDTPLFISETCPKTNTAGACPAKCRTCLNAAVQLRSSAKEDMTVLVHECRAVVLSQRPLNLIRLMGQLKEAGVRRVRADLSWRPRGPAQVANIMKSLRSGADSLPGHTGNFERRLM
jgi:collagenase-like PrtC family protease